MDSSTTLTPWLKATYTTSNTPLLSDPCPSWLPHSSFYLCLQETCPYQPLRPRQLLSYSTILFLRQRHHIPNQTSLQHLLSLASPDRTWHGLHHLPTKRTPSPLSQHQHEERMKQNSTLNLNRMTARKFSMQLNAPAPWRPVPFPAAGPLTPNPPHKSDWLKLN